MVDKQKIQEELPIELLQKGITISEAETTTQAKLKLSEIEGSLLQNQTYLINAKGVTPSLRNNNDGIAIFGYNDLNSSYSPDVPLNLPEDLVAQLKNPNIFHIYYRRDFQKYYLESIWWNKEIFFIFVRLDKPHMITNEIVVSVQNYNFKIKPNQNKDELQIEYGQSENLQKSVFSNKSKNVFYVGRKADCDIVLHDSEVSREQAIIYYENGNWFIKDGGKESSSLNGTWLYIERKYTISGDFVFKIGPSKMKIEFIEGQKQ